MAACDSSKGPATGTGGSASGRGGTGGSGGTSGGGRGGTAAGGSSGCSVVECLRPYECVRTCGGPIVRSSCCPCEAPLFDNFQNMACVDGGAGTGGTGNGGSSGTTGAAGRGGTTGSAGTGGASSGGRGGSGGTAGTTGAAGARGGTTGTAGAGGTTGAGGTGGARLCETVQCVRPYVCKASCGGPVVSNNCCPCEPPLFDDFNGQVCGDGGTGSVTYLGCTYVGGYDRVVVSKRDTARNLCFNVVLYDNPGTPTAGLTSPQNFRLEWSSVGPASACPARFPQSTSATQTLGMITQTSGGVGVPQTVDVNVTMSFGAGNDAGAPTAELLAATGIDVRPACQQ